MPYAQLADAVVVIHLAFVVFVVVGGFLTWRWRWIAALHIPAFCWGVWVEFTGWICPLTPLEVHLRLLAGQQGYTGGFVSHYLLPIVYPPCLTRPTQWVLGTFVLLLNIFVYAYLWRRVRRHAPR